MPTTYLKVSDVARLLAISATRVQQLADSRRLPVAGLAGRERLFALADVQAFAAGRVKR